MSRTWWVAASLVLAGCGAGTPAASSGVSHDQNLPDTLAPASEEDAPEISRSLGNAGGVVVLWPRIVRSRSNAPDEASTREIARALQARLAALLREKMPGVQLDVRPEPERVCPRSGCVGASVGVLLTGSGKRGCTATALVSQQGASPARLVPWAGVVKLKDSTSPFREPPETMLSVIDHVSCDSIVQESSARDQDVLDAVRRVLP